MTSLVGRNPAASDRTRSRSKVESLLRAAIIADYAEEKWPSMDLVADLLFERLTADYQGEIAASIIRPGFRRRLTRLQSERGSFVNFDRAINRYLYYPRTLRRVRHKFDVFHIVDHSYAHLVHRLPAERTIVTCHDIEAFRCLLPTEHDNYSIAHRAIARRTLKGLQRAVMISCDSEATRQELIGNRFASSERCVVIPNGVSAVFTPAANAIDDAEVSRLLGAIGDRTEILHVGSTVARKRIDRLLRVIAGVRRRRPQVRLVRVGGEFTQEQRKLVRELDLQQSVVSMPPISTATLAAIYRRAALLLITSDYEGFGLPMVEALACGTPALASSIPALREIGGQAVEYAPVDDLNAWFELADKLLWERAKDAAAWAERRAAGMRRARVYSWDESAGKIVTLYRQAAN